MPAKKRCSFMIDRELLERLREVQSRTGLSVAQQIREGVRWWLESREWPPGGRDKAGASGSGAARD
jgi:hypothetical protein